LCRPGVPEQLHEARAGVGARGDGIGVSVRVGVEVWVWHGEGDNSAGHGVGVLRIVDVGSAVEGRGHRRVGDDGDDDSWGGRERMVRWRIGLGLWDRRRCSQNWSIG
jgi:hypothetical protein